MPILDRAFPPPPDRSQLVRAFDTVTGLSPMACLCHMRVSQMARLLCSADLSIAETARAVGWTDANCASRCFHTTYGMSPTEFLRQHLPTLRAALDNTVAVAPSKEDSA